MRASARSWLVPTCPDMPPHEFVPSSGGFPGLLRRSGETWGTRGRYEPNGPSVQIWVSALYRHEAGNPVVSSSNSFPAGAESYRGVLNQEILPVLGWSKSRPMGIKPTTAGYADKSSGARMAYRAAILRQSGPAGFRLESCWTCSRFCPISIEFSRLELKCRTYALNRSESRL
jgi:hypothetical protein